MRARGNEGEVPVERGKACKRCADPLESRSGRSLNFCRACRKRGARLVVSSCAQDA